MTLAAPADHEIEDIYALSPLQRGILFHSLAAPRTGVYVNQVILPLLGTLDRSALRRAFQHLLDRHGILRTAFEWEGIEQPVQVVHRQVELPWFEHDFRGVDPVEQKERLERLCHGDRERGFDLSQVPLTRVHLVTLGEAEHALCWTHHHILLDGWSTPILTKELVQLYLGLTSGTLPVLPPARSFGEYIAWIEEQDATEAREYFRTLLAGFDGPVRLSIDLSGDAAGSEAPEQVASAETSLILEREISARVFSVAQKAGITPSVVIEAAWALVLNRYSGSNDIVFGVTLSGRPAELAGVESRVGLFINTLPLRLKLDSDTTGKRLFEILGRQHAELFRLQHTSLSDVISVTRVPRGQRLFETVIGFQNFPVEDAVRDAMKGDLSLGQGRGVEHGNFAATLLVSPGECIELVLSYVPSRFEARSMERALWHLRNAILRLTSEPNAPVFAHDLVDESEKESLSTWAHGPARALSPSLPHEIFLERARTRPDAPALVEASRTLSYADLVRLSSALASQLRGFGVGPEVRVAVCLERSADLVVAILGILRAGGAYVPLDPDYPDERLVYMLEDSRAPLIVTHSELVDRLPTSSSLPILIDELVQDASDDEESSRLFPANAAYVIYTSGSTGQPKGVVVTHAGLFNTALAQIDAFRIGPSSRVLQFASPSFDASVSEIFTALLAGATLYFRHKADLMPGPELVEWLDKNAISLVTVPPSALGVLPRASLPSLSTLVVAGEACPAELVQRWSRGRDFLNAYGPTEMTICVSVAECAPRALRPPIGRPITNVTAHVLDDQMRLVPTGVVGELYAGGPGVARGYLERPALTAERFVPSPFAPGERLYRTGDRVRWNLDGELEFVDRGDSQVKLRGYRIELGEIETAAELHPSVMRAVVLLRNEPPAPRLVLYVVPKSEEAPELEQDLRDSLARRLPEYMVPTAIVVMNELPQGPTGKIDKAALPLPERGTGPVERKAPATEAEIALAEIWQSVLRLDEISVEDHFFELGGDSLLSIQVVARAKERGLVVSIEDIFEHPKIVDLARVARQAVSADAEQGLVVGEMPLMPIQSWFFESHRARPHHHNMALLFQTSELVEPAIARRALGALLEHHDALRLLFDAERAHHVAVTEADLARMVTAYDLSDLDDADVRQRIEAHCQKAQRSLNVEVGPILQLVVFSLGRGRPNRVLWVLHHLVVDAVSWRLLLEDFQTACDQVAHDEEVVLPPKTLSLAEFSGRLSERAESEESRVELGYWLEQLARPVGAIPPDHQHGDNTVASASRVEAVLDGDVTKKLLMGFVKSHGAHANDVLLTAVARAFSAASNSATVSILLEGHGREAVPHVDVSRTVGWFTSIHPLVLRLSDTDDPERDLSEVVRQRRAVPQRGLGFLPLRQSAGSAGEALSALPLPTLSFNHLGRAENVLEAAGPVSIAPESAGDERDPDGLRPALFEINTLVLSGRLRLTLAFSTSFHTTATAERVLARIRTELSQLAERASIAGDVVASDDDYEAKPEMELDRIPVAPRDEPLPLSFAQERAWFLEQLDPGRPAYQSTFFARLRGALEPGRVARALALIVARHEGLRTTFPSVDGRAVQVVSSEGSLPLRFEDFSAFSAADKLSAVGKLRVELAHSPLDLVNGPVGRVVLVRLAPEDHALVVTFHLILADRWSMDLFVGELFAAYEALTRGAELTLRPLRLHYPDYAHWQRQRLSGRHLDDLIGFWRNELSEVPALELPADRPRPVTPLSTAARRSIRLDRELTQRIKTLGSGHGLTPFMTLLAVFEVLLHRLSGQETFAVGTTIANRPRAELESVFGYFANLLVFRVDFSGGPSFRELLRRVRASTLAAYGHQEMPFERIVEAVSPERNPSRNPIFQVMIVLHRQSEGVTLPSLELELPEASEETNAQFDLRVDLMETDQGLYGTFEYSTELFDDETIADWIRSYEQLIRSATADPDQPVARLAMLDDDSRRRLLVDFNQTQAPFPSEACLHVPFFERAREQPDSIAVVGPTRSLTYGALALAAARLARTLRAEGVGTNRLVAVVMKKGVEQIVATLGILAAGGAYLPIDPALPESRIQFLLQHAGAFAKVTQAPYARLVGGERTIVLDDAWFDAPVEDLALPSPGPSATDLAYVIYTSGSTGVPKGVALDHRGPVNTLVDVNQRFRVGAKDRTLLLSSLSFDLSVWDIFGTLAAGGAIVVPDAERERDPAHWVELIEKERVSVWNTVPALFELLVEELEHTPEAKVGALRVALLSGDWIPVTLPDRARRVLTGIELSSLGGATEGSVWSIAYPIGEVDPLWRSIPYGKPLKNQKFYVLDSELEPSPVGVPGELFIGGVGVALGYHNDPERTAQSFITHRGERLYRTGDFGRHLRSGDLEFLGRRDDQVKIRGYRIELGEIEAALRRQPAVRDAVVLARGPREDRRLVAYVVAIAPAPSSEELTRHLALLLPAYMVPLAFVVLDSFPLTPNGKVDKKALPEPEVAAADEQAHVEAHGAIEELIAAVFAEILGRPRVSADQSFFDLGGHSILATQAMARLRRTLELEIPLRWMFESPTISGLASRIEASIAMGRGEALPALLRVARDAGLSLSFAQERAWFLAELLPGNVAHRVECRARYASVPDLGLLRSSFDEVVERHPMLRTRFQTEAGRIVQSIDATARPELGARGDIGEPAWGEPLVRAWVDQNELCLVAHRIVADRPSLELVLREISDLYAQRLSGDASHKPLAAVRFADLAHWEREQVRNPGVQSRLVARATQLADVPRLELPPDRPRPLIQPFAGASVPVHVTASLAEELTALAHSVGAQPFAALVAALELVLARHSGQSEFAVGTLVSGRNLPEAQGLVGPLENRVAIRAKVHGEMSFRTLVCDARDELLAAHLDRDLPFERVVDEIHPERDTARHAIFQALLLLHPKAPEPLSLGAIDGEILPALDDVALYDVAFELTQTRDGISGRVVFKADIFEPETVARLAEHWVTALSALVARPDALLDDVQLASADEIQLVTRRFADGSEPGVTNRLVHERFLAQAQASPERIAIVQGEASLSYRELEDAATGLAGRLSSIGVGPEVVVGVLLHRTLDLPKALLGVLIAGGAYLPLEPSYPDERLAYILADSGARFVLTVNDLAPRVRAAGKTPILLEELGHERTPKHTPRVHEASLAYSIYTSGSTGRPKGVGVSHAALSNFLATMEREPGIEPDDRLLSVTSPSFDIFALELFLPLVTGAMVMLAPREVVIDGERLLGELGRATMLQATPATFRLLLAAGWKLPETRTLKLISGGEALPGPLAVELEARSRELWNVYGPTETTVWSTRRRLGAADVSRERAPTIGGPIGGTQVYVLDPRMRPVPVLVWGELFIGGSGVARGYHERPELTAERFVPDPLGNVAGERLYRTGDRCRFRSNGDLEFSSRLDQQVKLRGHRIELGEIEAVLSEHPGVADVAVSLCGDSDDARLIGYVVPRSVTNGDEEGDIVTRWNEVWDGAYALSQDDPELDTTGYVSSYDKKPIPKSEMQEWLDCTVEHVEEAGDARRILEIGCGTGMVLGRLSAGADLYLATDGSEAALQLAARSIPKDAEVRLVRQEAKDFTGIEPRGFDRVVLNSVVQYFPDADYLGEVLRGAVDAVRDGGSVFVGDVRSKSLSSAFALSVELEHARSDMSASELRARSRSRVRFEAELVLDPEVFLALARDVERIGGVRLRTKLSSAKNELTSYRYDVVLEVGPRSVTPRPSRVVDFATGDLSETRLGELLSSGVDSLVVENVPHPGMARFVLGARMLEGADAPKNVRELRARLELDAARRFDPYRFRALGRDLGFCVRLSTAHPDGSVDVAFVRDGAATPRFRAEERRPDGAFARFVNRPLDAARERALLPELRRFASERLPDYMLPQAFALLDALPLTTSGKIDRRALPAPEETRIEGAFSPPRTQTETTVARIFADALRLDRVGAHADFFALGGHSLLGTHVIALLRDELDVELPLRSLFASPTVAGMASLVDQAKDKGEHAHAPRMARAGGELVLPLSYAQERMWFIDRLYSGRGVFNIPQNFRVVGDFDFGALRRAFDALTERHEALRTVIREVDGSPAQIILPNVEVVEPEVIDLTLLPRSEREQTVERMGHDHAARSFDLERGPLVHAVVLRLAPDEHVVLMTMHHIVADGWSLGILYTELTALYAAFREGRPSPLAPLELQYADYAVWQRKWMQGDVLERHVAWWKERLLGFEPLELPTDRPRPAQRDYDGATVDVDVPEANVAALRELCQAEGATLFMGLCAAFLALMRRTSAQSDITIGTALANRTRAEIGGLIGFFINTPALRSDLSDNPSFRELLRRTKELTLDVYEWQDAPFEKIVEALHPERDPSRYPIYNVIFGLQNMPGGRMTRAGDAKLRQLGAHTGYARYDLTIQVVDAGDLSVSWEYAVALFDESTVEQLGRHFARLVELFGQSPDLRIDDVVYQTEDELRELEALSEPRLSGERSARTIQDLVFAQADRTPEANAIVGVDGQALTYAGLRQRALGYSARLLEAGVRPEDKVAVALEKSPELLAAALGVVSIGACFVPLDPSYPCDRLELLLSDSGARVLVTTGALKDQVPVGNARVLLADEAWELRRIPRLPDVAAEHGAYIIYTSGSTGRPKGVVVQHDSVVHVLSEVSRQVGASERKNLLWFTSPSFDATILELLMTLMSGATIHVLPPERLLPGPDLIESLSSRSVDTFIVIASALEQLPLTELPQLQNIIVGGEASTAESLQRWSKGRRLFVAYGPTETTIIATMGPSDGSHAHYTLGRPLPGVSAYVLDPQMKPVPIGVFGELFLGGRCVARGYHARPELDAERFVPDPFGKIPGRRLYKTGDRARWRRDGTLEFAGRLDHQIKLRGYRIELGEIETALASLAGIRHAVVLMREDTPGDKRLVAYVVADGSSALTPENLRRELERVLPAYMVPPLFVLLPELPRTPTGKIDKKALGPPEPELADDLVSPRTPLEELVAGAFAEVLGLPAVGVDQRFFDIGGHSLLATRLVTRIRERIGVELPLSVVFEEPTVERLARRVEALRLETDVRPPPLVRVERTGDIPLSFAQERLWFLDQLSPGEATYNTPIVVRLKSAFDDALLEHALLDLIRRHESLRTSFPSVAGSPVQLISDEPRFDLRRLDLPGAGEAELRAELEAEVRRPFDLISGPLVRVLLVSLGPEDVVLCLTLHHIVIDGWSLGVLMQELFELYDAATTHRTPSLPELAVQYADYAIWQRSWLSGEALEEQLRYWRERLGDIPRLELPLDRPRPLVDTHAGALVPIAFDPELSRRVQSQARAAGVTTFMLLLGAFGALLGRLSGQRAVAIGFPIAGRRHAEIEGLIGFFVNTLVARVDLNARPSFRKLCLAIKEDTLGAYAHQDVPFEKLVEVLAPERSTNQSPLFQAAFILEREISARAPGSLPMQAMPVELGTAKVELSLTLSERADGYEGVIEYNVDLFDRERIEQMAKQLQRWLVAALEDPDRPLDEISFDSDAEHDALVARSFGEVTLEAEHEGFLHELVQKCARSQTSTPAIVDRGREWSYAELVDTASRLAAELHHQGVGCETRVALALERLAELVVCMLAVLEAGGAYVPLDATLPRERLELLLRDSGATHLVLDERAELLPWPEGLARFSVSELILRSRTNSAAVPRLPSTELGAYVIYTSGSTGVPKGVVVPHRGVVNTILAASRALGLAPGQRVVPVCSPSFDVFGWEVFTALAAGATLYFGEAEELEPGEPLRAFLGKVRANVLSIVPSTLALLGTAELPDLTTLALGGETPTPELLERWTSRTRVIDAYGPTEISICASIGEITPGDAVNIGKPLSNVSTYVLDERFGSCPLGVWGELCVGGRGVARAYHDRPELSAERFVPDPFASTIGSRMYRTGDRVRWRSDGRLEFGGRLDNQVKLRGLRIELGEVEVALARCSGVKHAAVIVREDAPGDQRLVAYVAPRATAPASSDLRARLERTLPAYLVPANIVLLDELPLTASGKLDRRALPRPEIESGSLSAPESALEALLCRIYSELLSSGPVGTDHGFFELGGHSLMAARLKARLLAETGRSIPLKHMFQSRLTVRELARLVEQGERLPSSGSVTELASGAREPVFAIHRAATNVLGYLELARRLPGHRVLGIGPIGLEAGEKLPTSIAELADQHALAIARHVPEGRLHLVGHSMGGFLALEIARRLLAQGRDVGLLALIDSIWPSPELARVTRAELASSSIERLQLDRLVTADVPEAELVRHASVVQALIQATLDYAEGTVELAHPVLLLEARDVPEHAETRLASRHRWQNVARSGLDVEQLPGDHETALELPHVDHAASILLRHLARWRER